MSNKYTPLDDIELYDLIAAAYPEKFKGDSSDADYDAVMDFVDDMFGKCTICWLLGRVVMMTMPVKSPLTGEAYHAFGNVAFKGDTEVDLHAVVRRKVEIQPPQFIDGRWPMPDADRRGGRND